MARSPGLTNHQLTVTYRQHTARISFEFPQGTPVHRLVVKPRGQSDVELWSQDAGGKPSGSVEVPLDQLASLMTPALAEAEEEVHHAAPTSAAEASAPNSVASTVGPMVFTVFWFEVGPPAAATPEAQERVFVRLSGATKAAIETSRPFVFGDVTLTPFVSTRGRFGTALGRGEARPKLQGRVTRWHRRPGKLGLTVKVKSGSFGVVDAHLRLEGRQTDQTIVVPATVHENTVVAPNDQGRREFVISSCLDEDTWLKSVTKQDLFDAHLELRFAGCAAPGSMRVSRANAISRTRLPAALFNNGVNAGELRAYRTYRQGLISFEFRPLHPRALNSVRWATLLGPYLRMRSIRRPVWLVGDRLSTAQDNGLEFYRHLRREVPDVDARYVIDGNSPDLPNVTPTEGVVLAGTKEHVQAALSARRIFGTHHLDYLLPVRSGPFQRAVRAKRIFLQHGIMGTKNLVAMYGYDSPTFQAEAFIVSSERERNMIIDDFGWPADRVHATGLARFDRLFAEHPPPEPTLLILPTWRDWLKNDQDVAKSEYLERWVSLLKSERFARFLDDHGLTADLYLHYNMQPFAERFASDHVRILKLGEVPVQDLLIRSQILLTDYTSAALDFSFLDRPIVYYQFDRSSFIGPRPSHFALDRELPGDIAFTESGVLDQLESAGDRGFTQTDEMHKRSDALIAFRDQSASARIVDVARQPIRRRHHQPVIARVPGKIGRVIRHHPAYQRVRSRARNRLFEIAGRLPARKPLIFFETNLGADTGDSPGAISAELRERHPDVRIAWSVKGAALPFEQPIECLRRGTLRHHWAMGRATVWISNQNFPAHLRRPKRTHYLQTWHGTPLKRMLHDLDEIVGRDEGYVDRVDTMIGEWSTLLSPSPWASERFASAFQYQGRVLEVGYPRNDVLRRTVAAADRRKHVQERLGLDPRKKTVLYAPTFRDTQKVGKRFTFDITLQLEMMSEKLLGTHELVVRLHPIIRKRTRLPAGVRDGGGQVDMADLLCATDVLITDYSSVMFDFANTERPMIFFAPDLEEYSGARGFYLDYETQVPGPILTTTGEVVDALENPEELAAYAGRRAEFRERFCPLDDGQAARRVVDYLEQLQLLSPQRPT